MINSFSKQCLKSFSVGFDLRDGSNEFQGLWEFLDI